MQTKTTMRYHLPTVRMAIMTKITNNKYWRGCEKTESLYTVGGNVNWCSHYEKQYVDFLKKLKIELPYDSVILLLGIYAKNHKNTNSRRYMHPYAHYLQ